MGKSRPKSGFRKLQIREIQKLVHAKLVGGTSKSLGVRQGHAKTGSIVPVRKVRNQRTYSVASKKSAFQKLRAENDKPLGSGYPAKSKALRIAMERALTAHKTQNSAQVLTLLKDHGAA